MTAPDNSLFFWLSFLTIVIALLALDLGVFHRKAKVTNVKEAFLWSAVWVALSLAFGAWIHVHFGAQKGLEFFAGYLIEYALSVDNVFVFIMIFSYFAVPPKLHHKVLFWGIVGALGMRAVFILAGSALLHAFHWIMYLFGVLLVFTGAKIMRKGDTEVEPARNPVVRLFKRMVPVTTEYGSGRFFVRERGRLLATPLALVLITVETTDLVFATDSIPAIFGITSDPFVVYTSNICAIMGLRSMYFLLAAVVDRFAYLGTGIGIILIFIGIKMLIGGVYSISITISLSVVVVILAGCVLISVLWPPANHAKASKQQTSLVTSPSEEKNSREE